MSAATVEAVGIAKAYPGVQALRGASLRVDPGEIVGLVGKNGAGKSTLIKVLAGVVRADAGSIRIAGDEVALSGPADATAHGLAFVHQELTHAPALTVAENILLGIGYPKRGPLVRRRALRATVRELLARLESDIDPDATVGTLSPAQQRLVMIARALAQDARLLVLDEPSAALTDDEIAHLHAVLRRLAAEGVSVVYITHRLDEVLSLTTRVVVMRDARVVDERPTAELSRDQLVELITGRAVRLALTRAERPRPAPAPDAAVTARYRRPGDRVALEVRAGEIVGIAGLVGSGRSALVRQLFGADGATRGVELHGRTVPIRSPREAVRRGVALLPEDRRGEGNLVELSITRNLSLATLDRHRLVRWLPVPSRRHEAAAARAAVARLQIKADDVRTRVGWLSGGNQQKVVLGKWLASDADLYVFDEPSQGIDVGAKEEAFAMIDDLAAAGKAVVLVSSDFSELISMCDRVLVMRDGALVSEHPAADVTEPRLVAECYRAEPAVVGDDRPETGGERA
jgi:ABC-type sugar transport system ATPase subunit